MSLINTAIRHVGNKIDHVEERDRAVYDEFKKRTSGSSDMIDLDMVSEEIAKAPSPRFWVSTERALAVVRELNRGRDISVAKPYRREMFLEIHRRVKELRERRPELALWDAVYIVVMSPAPEFYMSPRSVYMAFTRERKRSRIRRMQSRKRATE